MGAETSPVPSMAQTSNVENNMPAIPESILKEVDPKGKLQTFWARSTGRTPTQEDLCYKAVKVGEQLFFVELQVTAGPLAGNTFRSSTHGRKKDAEQEAARRALWQLEQENVGNRGIEGSSASTPYPHVGPVADVSSATGFKKRIAV